ncbi:fasciclin domain-containing protein [Oryzobacter terrae]|uniref:fasciclin domain-containing protein n=1 Tax=Oryzobacter terrae TaxID=1620385 RepID=UPI00366E193D
MIRRRIASTVAIASALATVGLAAAPAASAATGDRSLATVLTSDGNRFDRNWYDYDIVTEAVLAVLAAKPDSAVGVLADGDVALTAFIPNDRAFQVLAADLTKRWSWSEEKVFGSLVAAVGVDAVEQVLLYHVVPGTAITAAQAVKANGATLTTAQGATIGVRVWSPRLRIVELRDQDRNDVNPFLVPRALDINAGNAQIAHGIAFVLRPADL